MTTDTDLTERELRLLAALTELRETIMPYVEAADDCSVCAEIEENQCPGHMTLATLNLLLDKGDPASDVMFMPSSLLVAIAAVVPDVVARGCYTINADGTTTPMVQP